LERFWKDGVEETDEAFRERIASRPDPVWLTEHDVEGAFQKVLIASKEELTDNARL
jgi:hypothetical protein